MEIREPKIPGILWATPDLLRDCFNSYSCYHYFNYSNGVFLILLYFHATLEYV